MDVKDCENCIHCLDKKYWTCEYDEPCVDHSLYEPEEPQRSSNDIAT